MIQLTVFANRKNMDEGVRHTMWLNPIHLLHVKRVLKDTQAGQEDPKHILMVTLTNTSTLYLEETDDTRKMLGILA